MVKWRVTTAVPDESNVFICLFLVNILIHERFIVVEYSKRPLYDRFILMANIRRLPGSGRRRWSVRVRVKRTINFMNDKTGRPVICNGILLDATSKRTLDKEFIKGTIHRCRRRRRRRRHCRRRVRAKWNK